MPQLAQLLQLVSKSRPGQAGGQMSQLAIVTGWQMTQLANVSAPADLPKLAWASWVANVSAPADLPKLAWASWLANVTGWQMSQIGKCHRLANVTGWQMSQVGKCHCSSWPALALASLG